MPESTILHLDLDSFFVSVERLKDTSLQHKPLIIGGPGDRGVVASCSYETRKFGVYSGMPIKQAKRLCPHAIIRPSSFEDYGNYSSIVTEVIAAQVPLFEKSSIDEFYVDLSGMERFFGCQKIAGELRQRIMRETGLPISMCLSTSKTLSKIGTDEAKPNGELYIQPGDEKKFLFPLSVKKIPMVGQSTFEVLQRMGIETIGQLAATPPEVLSARLGKMGLPLWEKANGIHFVPVVPYWERKSVSTESTFEKDINDSEQLAAIIASMAEKLCYQIRRELFLVSCVGVKVRYYNFDTVMQQQQLPATNREITLIKTATHLFKKIYGNRMMVRLVGVRFDSLVHADMQQELFADHEKEKKLFSAVDRVKNRFGGRALSRAAAEPISEHRFF